jgi:drug/metabolite transporter (DMT)-like permease
VSVSRFRAVTGRAYREQVSTTVAPPEATATRKRVLLLGAIAFTVLAWASAFVVIRGVAPEVGGGALALGRLLVGVVALGILVAVQRRWVWPTRSDWVRLVVYGVGWFGAYNVALNLAEHTLDAGTTAMIVNIGPILIALGAGLFLGEGIPRWLAIGAGVAFLGVLLIGIGTSLVSNEGRPIDPIGVLWCLAAALTYAIGVLAQKPMAGRLPASQVTLIGAVIGAIACLPFAGQLASELATASSASCISASCRPLSRSRPGDTPSAGCPRDSSASRPTSCRRWPSSWA